jgi:hypothetical protein
MSLVPREVCIPALLRKDKMKESVIDVLMYRFERYADDDQDAYPDRKDLRSRLSEAGFSILDP